MRKLCCNQDVTPAICYQISAKCDAEKLGIRAGDVIFSCQKKRVSSIVQVKIVVLIRIHP
jgi:S1-C subfamily serine protease